MRFAEWLESFSARTELDQVELVSFDVFDTLLFRRCSADTVQRGVAAEISKALGQASGTIDSVLRAREQAYADAAKINLQAGLDFEAHLDAINLGWVKRVAPEAPERWDELALIAREKKTLFERWACYPNPMMRPLLQDLQKRGKRRFFSCSHSLLIPLH
jgi:hypothetical protein